MSPGPGQDDTDRLDGSYKQTDRFRCFTFLDYQKALPLGNQFGASPASP